MNEDSVQKFKTHCINSSLRKNIKGDNINNSEKADKVTQESSKYIYGVLWACSLVLIWKHMWIIHLLPIPIAVYLIKHIGMNARRTFRRFRRFLHYLK